MVGAKPLSEPMLNQCQAVIWTNAKPLSEPIWTNAGTNARTPLGTNFSVMSIEIHRFLFKKMHVKLSCAKSRPFCLSLDVLSLLYGLCVWTLLLRWPQCRCSVIVKDMGKICLYLILNRSRQMRLVILILMSICLTSHAVSVSLY